MTALAIAVVCAAVAVLGVVVLILEWRRSTAEVRKLNEILEMLRKQP